MKGEVVIGPEDEDGGPIDTKSAFRCYSRETKQHPGNYYILGYMYHHGIGVKRNDAHAVQMLTKAKAYSDWRPAALYELAEIYRDSHVIPRDPVRSVVLLAEAQGSPLTPQFLCGHFELPNDKGGPAIGQNYDARKAEQELESAFYALSVIQKAQVARQLTAENLSIPRSPTDMSNIPDC